ncbi:MAG: right-handed parallel beta-helix repeat-containing protein [Spirochaetaceae bacterium]|jgi:hypothetical protein|nr:right-handed parallel beta-helix repeat-containing protein [Spirochaetaceae bacterium]
MNRKKMLWFCLVLVAGGVVLLAGCEGGISENIRADEFDPSILSFYVASEAEGGSDENDGTSEDTPLATLANAYAKAQTDPDRKRVVVLSNLSEEGLVTLAPVSFVPERGHDAESIPDLNSRPDNGSVPDADSTPGAGSILIEGRISGLKIERSTGANDSVLQIQDGAKIAFKNIMVEGKSTNRAILVTGSGTEVVLENKAMITGKSASNDGSGIAVREGGKLVMKMGSVVSGCTGGSNMVAVYVVDGGDLEMNGGSRIYGNTALGGVKVKNGTFTMYGGEISGNSATNNGGGVYLDEDGEFTMEGGLINGNKAANSGGGIYLDNGGKFMMKAGVISGNEAVAGKGGGISATGKSTVQMGGGRINGNSSKQDGGGIDVCSTHFIMEGGEISGNIASGNGGGVFLDNQATSKFTMTGGVIYGSKANLENQQSLLANSTTDGLGAALFKSESAIIVNAEDVRGTTEVTIDKRQFQVNN